MQGLLPVLGEAGEAGKDQIAQDRSNERRTSTVEIGEDRKSKIPIKLIHHETVSGRWLQGRSAIPGREAG